MGVKLGNGKWAIKEDKLLAYNDNSGRFFNKEFDFSRGSSATYVAKDGLIENTTGDIPRIDFSDTVKGALLLEPQSTNLVTYSEDFTGWGFTSASKSLDNSIVSPDGGSGVQKLTAASGNSFHFANFNATLSGKQSFSVFLKKGTVSQASMFLSESGNNGGIFDLENGLVESVTGLNVVGEIINYGNGWFRCILNHTSTNDLSNSVRIGINNGALNSFNAVGDEAIYIWAAQLEEGYATSYIPTSGSTATRNADVCNNSGSAQDFNSEEGVLYAEISAFSNNLEYRILSVSDGSTNNRAYLQYTNLSNQIKFVYKVGSVTQAGIGTGGFDIVDYHKIACKWKANDFALWIDGNEIGTDTNGSVNPKGTFTQLNFDDGAGNADFYGNIRDLQVFTEALTDEQLQKLTS